MIPEQMEIAGTQRVFTRLRGGRPSTLPDLCAKRGRTPATRALLRFSAVTPHVKSMRDPRFALLDGVPSMLAYWDRNLRCRLAKACDKGALQPRDTSVQFIGQIKHISTGGPDRH